MLVDLEVGIVDARAVILRAVEHDGPALDTVLVARDFEVGAAEIVGDDRGLHDRGVEQVARKHQEPGIGLQRFGEGPDDVAVRRLCVGDVLGQGLASDGHGIAVEQTFAVKRLGHGRHAARPVIGLAEITPGGLAIDQQRHLVAIGLPVLQLQLDLGMAGDGLQVDRRVGRPADGRVDADGVQERPARQDIAGFQILPHHLDNAPPGQIGHGRASGIGRGDRGAAGQRKTERLGQAVHGERGAHGVAVPGRGRRLTGPVDESFIVDLAGGEQLPCLPLHHAGARQLTLPPGVQHRPAGQRDGRNVDRGGGHQGGRRGLVAADREHDAVEGITVQDFDLTEIGKIAVEHRRRPTSRLLDRVHGEFEGHATGVADAVAHARSPTACGDGCTAKGRCRFARWR